MKSKAPLLLMEQMVMLLVFALAAALCLQAFVKSDGLSGNSEARDRAVTLCQTAAETVRHSGGWSGQLWELDLDGLHAAVAGLDNVEVTSVDRNGRVRLSVLDHSAAGLCTTIPAEEGWSAWVDGQRVELETWLDTFLCLALPAGAREVELRYTPPGLLLGLELGALSLAGLALATVKKRKRR